jgi:subtilisin family serine protease
MTRATFFPLPRRSQGGAILAQTAALAALLACAPVAMAQLQPLPPLPQAAAPITRTLGQVVDPLMRDATTLADRTLTQARQLGQRQLLREHRDVLDTDPNDNVVIRSQVLALAPTPEALERARQAGFTVEAPRRLDGLDLEVVPLRAPAGQSTRRAVEALRALDPAGSYDYDHLYASSGAAEATSGAAATSAAGAATPWRVGLVDSGVDAGHPALQGARVQRWGCEDQPHPDLHGTAVASLLVGDGQHAQPGVQLFAADVYCGAPTGGNALEVAQALAWLARQQVRVVNLSLVGPDNALLKRAVASAIGRGMVVVAAVGNDGPAAAPLFPSAYPQVIGVTAVDPRNRVLPEAGRGPQVDLAAVGAQVEAAAPGGRFERMRGTSFAAPRVAALAAQALAAHPDEDADALLSALAAHARDLGKPGPDPVYGRGLVPGTPDEQAATR